MNYIESTNTEMGNMQAPIRPSPRGPAPFSGTGYTVGGS